MADRRTKGRPPPHNLGAEESLLGAMLLSADAIAEAVAVCRAEDFYKPAHGVVFATVVDLFAKGQPVDPVTVADELRRTGQLDLVGGGGVLVSLAVNTPAISNAARYAGIVEELASLRRLVTAGAEIAELGMGADLTTDVAAILDRAETVVFQAAERRSMDTRRSVAELLPETLDYWEALYTGDSDVSGIPTGFADLDGLLAGLHKSNLVIVGARPAMGKTAFALNVSSHVAMKVREPVLLFSLEMSRREIMGRLIAAEARIDSMGVRSGRLRDDDWAKISKSMQRLGDAPLYIDDLEGSPATVMDLRARARRQKARDGLGLIVVDYIQLMGTGHRGENRQAEVAEISRGLKLMARDLDVPVLALSQLSRNLEVRADKRPQLSDLRESGALEQDADVVVFIYRDEVYNPEHTPSRGAAELIVAKHRHGPIGTANVAFLARHGRFADMARA